jgi:allophanate hydrolase subunit 2
LFDREIAIILMGLLVINPGVFATVQDLGRTGYREWGVPVGGAFDRGSAALANALLGNPPGCAVLELTLFGGVYEARIPLALALAGAPMTAEIEHEGSPSLPIAVPQSFSIAPRERLVIGGTSVGARTYLAVKEGWRTPLLLGSRSREERLTPGVVLDAQPASAPARHPAEHFWEPPSSAPLRILEGPDASQASGFAAWSGAPFRVGRQVDRMGIRLEGPALSVTASPERISMPVAPGAIQVAGGQAILLGVACGTMGGYPHVAHVITPDLDRVGQLRPGDTFRFQRVTLDEARRIDQDERRTRADLLRRLAVMARDHLERPPAAPR